MDWHVRRNRSERQSAGRGAPRRWLPRADEWENERPTAGSAGDGESSAMGVAADDSATTGPGHGAGAGAGVAGEGKPQRSVEELKRKFVKVPPGKNGQGGGGEGDVKCPICKEAFRAEWSEDEEEWVWRNAISVNGKVRIACTLTHTIIIAMRMTRTRRAMHSTIRAVATTRASAMAVYREGEKLTI